MSTRPPEGTAPPPGRAAIGRRLRDRLGSLPQREEWPPVSIVVLNRDGEGHLRRLLPLLASATDYPALELVLVDNASSDDSVAYARSARLPFPLTVIENDRNLSFSDANNDGADRASHEYLLFLNNDVEPFEPGWLKELVACLQEGDVAAAGATLLHGGEVPGRPGADYVVQHRGVEFASEAGRLIPLNAGDGGELRLAELDDVGTPALTAACLLIRRAAFEGAGGFTTGFLWGWEDVDLGLKLGAAGERLVCSGRSVLFHHHSSTRFRRGKEWRRRTRAQNQRLLIERWGPQARREYLLERLGGGRHWTDGRPPSLALALPAPEEDQAEALRLADGIEAAGWRVSALAPGEAGWESPPDDADFVLLADPGAGAALPSDACPVAWIRDRVDTWLAGPWLRRAELTLVSSLGPARTLESAGVEPVLFPGEGDAAQLIDLLRERTQRLRFCLKLSRDWDLEPAARFLRRSLELRGHACALQLADEWELLSGACADVVVVVGDPGAYSPKPAQLNVLWVREPPRPTECDAWDLVLLPDAETVDSLRPETPTEVAALDLEGEADPAEFLLDLVARAGAGEGLPTRVSAQPRDSSTSRA